MKSSRLRKHWKWKNFSWAISNPKRWCCETAPLNMPANLENSAVATELRKVSFHPNPKEGQCQRMFKLFHSCTHFTCQQGNAENSSSYALIVHELRTSRCTSWFRIGRGTRDQIASICWIIGNYRKNIFLLHWVRQSLWLWGSQQIVENSSGDGNTKPAYMPSEKPVHRSRSNT